MGQLRVWISALGDGLQEHRPQYTGAGVQSSGLQFPVTASLCLSPPLARPHYGLLGESSSQRPADSHPLPALPPFRPLGVSVGGQAAVQPCIYLLSASSQVTLPWLGRLLHSSFPFSSWPPAIAC